MIVSNHVPYEVFENVYLSILSHLSQAPEMPQKSSSSFMSIILRKLNSLLIMRLPIIDNQHPFIKQHLQHINSTIFCRGIVGNDDREGASAK